MSYNFARMKIFFIYLIATICIVYLASCNRKIPMQAQTISYALRLKPGQDLRKSLQSFVAEKNIKAGWVATCAGSLTQYNIRFANEAGGSFKTGYFEIVSLSGTLSVNGNHVHIAVSDSTGKTIGGHLLENCLIYTTAEIIIQSASNIQFSRKKDGTTAWEELQIEEN